MEPGINMRIVSFVILSFLLCTTLSGCGQSDQSTNGIGDNDKNPAGYSFVYPEKTDIVQDRQYYVADKVHFPDGLWQTPYAQDYSVYDIPGKNIKAYFIESVAYSGKPTKVFVYVGMPKMASAANPVPGVVLVHGGGGTAYSQWVEQWNAKGYAAIAMDTDGKIPDIGLGSENPHHHGPANSAFGDGNKPIEEQWAYQATASVIASVSFLKSFPEVDGSKIGINGISYGGVLSTIALGYDDRLAFGIPVYGCLSLTESGGNFGTIFKGNPASAAVWDDLEPLKNARTPIFFVNGNQDNHFTLDATSGSAAACKYGEMLIIDQFSHGHQSGWSVSEAYAFADSVVKKKADSYLTRFTMQPSFEAFPEIELPDGVTPLSAKMFYSTDSAVAPATEWKSMNAAIHNNEIHYDVTASIKYLYVNVTDSRGFTVTSRLVKL